MELVRYNPDLKRQWDAFISEAKNESFLFHREYMDYHADRFEDSSLLFYKKNKIIALFPCNRVHDCVFSHQGLTFGGIISSVKINIEDIILIFNLSNQYFLKRGITKVIYKPSPYIYHSIPSQEDLYALFRLKAKIIGRNISTVIPENNRIKFIESRLSGLRKARSKNFLIHYNGNLKEYWNLLESCLQVKYKTKPVHTLSEMSLLMERFPENIKLYTVEENNTILGGAILYSYKQITKVQYIASSDEGKDVGVLDFLFDVLINNYFKGVHYFDMGSSNEEMGNYLNKSLIFQKEGFGGRAVCYDTYEYSTSEFIKL